MTPAQLFWSNVAKGGPRECWDWQGNLDANGYGSFSLGNKSFRAHRYSYALTHGRVPEGCFVCHKCDNPACVNPVHLYAGTAMDNAQDRSRRGRSYPGGMEIVLPK